MLATETVSLSCLLKTLARSEGDFSGANNAPLPPPPPLLVGRFLVLAN